MRIAAYLLMLLALPAYARLAVVPADQGTYIVASSAAQFGMGAPVKQTTAVYDRANEFCERKDQGVETIALEKTNSGFARPGNATLTFRCVPKK